MKVGAFTYDAASGTLTGPAAYMADRGDAMIRRIAAGHDPCGAFTFSPDPITAALVTLQTDYAGWLGEREIAAWSRKAPARSEFPRSRRAPAAERGLPGAPAEPPSTSSRAQRARPR